LHPHKNKSQIKNLFKQKYSLPTFDVANATSLKIMRPILTIYIIFLFSIFFNVLYAQQTDLEKIIEQRWNQIDSLNTNNNTRDLLLQLVDLEELILDSDLSLSSKSNKIWSIYQYPLDSIAIQNSFQSDELALGKAYEYIGLQYMIKDEIDSAYQKMHLASMILSKEDKAFRSFRWLGYIASLQGDLSDAINFYQKSIEQAKLYFKPMAKRGHLLISNSHANMSQIHVNRNDFRSAMRNTMKAMEHAEYANESLSVHVAESTRLSILRWYEDPKIVIKQMEEFKQNHERKGGRVSVALLNALGKAYFNNQDYERAIYYFDKCLTREGFSRNRNNIFNDKGFCYYEQKKYHEAIKVSDEIISSYSERDKNREILTAAHYNRARSLYKLGEFKEAQNDLTLAMGHLDPIDHQMVYQLALKAPIYMGLYRKTKQRNYLDSALHSIQYSDQYIQNLREKRRNFEDQITFGEHVYDGYISNLEVLSEIYEIDSSEQDFDLIFKNIVGLKSYTLKEMLRTDDAVQIGVLPEEILAKEKAYKFDLGHLEHKIYQWETSNPDTNILQDYRLSFSVLKENYYGFLQKLEEDYPKYYRHQYKDDFIELQSFQSLLSDQEAVIAYFITDTSMFTMTVSREEVSFQKTSLPDNWNEDMSKFKTLISDPQSDVISYQELSYKFKELLLGDIFGKLNSDINRLRFIPDDVLNYIPFEALVSEKINGIQKFKDLSYLCKKYTISYVHSYPFLANSFLNKSQENHDYGYLGFAPIYAAAEQKPQTNEINNNIRGPYSDLPYARENVTKVSDLFNGKAFIGETATTEAFSLNASKSSILHLAMHGQIDFEKPTQSHLLFHAQDSSSRLYLNEVYGLQLSCDVAVLGACNTGAGEIINGDGIQNMSRAFLFAGAKNTVMSLWSVPDIQTAEVNYSFFEKIKEQQSIDKALQNAKLEYLENTSELRAHPFYWAGLVAQGSMNPISDQNNFWNSSLLLIGPGILLIAFLVIYFLKIKSSSKD